MKEWQEDILLHIFNAKKIIDAKYWWPILFKDTHTTRSSIFCNQSLCNWHATSCHLQLSW
jgi:hypothetical protein